jgi:hypothetical protein
LVALGSALRRTTWSFSSVLNRSPVAPCGRTEKLTATTAMRATCAGLSAGPAAPINVSLGDTSVPGGGFGG